MTPEVAKHIIPFPPRHQVAANSGQRTGAYREIHAAACANKHASRESPMVHQALLQFGNNAICTYFVTTASQQLSVAGHHLAIKPYAASRIIHHGGQVNKGVWRMSRRQEAMKGVEGCEKPGVAVKQAMIPGFPNYHALNP